MAKNLVEKGNLSSPLILYNRTTSRAEALASKLGSNARAVKNIEEAIEPADIIFICLGDDPAVTAAVGSILDSKPSIKNKLVVDCSTVHPDTTRDISERLTDAGAGFVAMPVFGAPAMADAGQLVCVQAGPKALIDRIKPYCVGVMGRAEIDYSDQPPSQATLLKLIGNTFILSMVETLSEGLVVAEKTGLGVDNLHKFIELMFPGPYAAYSTRMRSGDYYKRDEPLFAVDLARKDARHAQDLAQRAGVTMKNVQLADALLAGVQVEQGERGDIAGMYGAKRKEASLPYDN